MTPTIELTYEAGPAYIAQNEGRYGEAGTPFEAGDVGQQKTLVVGQRASLELGAGRHTLVLLYAPLALVTRFTPDEPFRFRDTTFAPGRPVDHRYVFDGYRASYLYRLVGGALSWEVGASLQIRSADVAFSAVDGSAYDAQDDIGLVPALKTRLVWAPAEAPAWAALEADGLSTFGLAGDTSGGIYDVALAVGFPMSERLDVFLNVRLVGGGAEVPEQEFRNWANFVSASAGVRISLDGLLARPAAR
jgi:hypothetical protein